MPTYKPIRIGILGLGRAGWGMQTGALRGREDFEIAAVCDVEQDRRSLAAQEFGCATYADYREFVRDPNVELVSVATRSFEHMKHAVAALKAGKHTMIEKPMALNLRQADRIFAVAGESEGELIIRHNRRFDNNFLMVREVVASGKLGEVIRVKLYRQSYARRDDWQSLREFGGGQLRNWGPHIIDHGLQLMGAPVKKILARVDQRISAGDAEDDLKIVMVGENGVLVDIEISGADAIGRENVFKVVGTRGGLVVNKELTLKILKRPLKKTVANPATPSVGGGFGRASSKPVWTEKTLPLKPRKTYDFWTCVFDTLRKGKPFPVTHEEAREVVRVTDLVARQTGW